MYENSSALIIAVRADTDGLDKGRDFVIESLGFMRVNREVIFSVTTAFLEHFENIIKHGYNGHGPGNVTVEAQDDGENIKLVITDNAAEFNLLAHKAQETSKKSGAEKMGIKTIKTLCDRVDYFRRGDCNVTTLIKTKGGARR